MKYKLLLLFLAIFPVFTFAAQVPGFEAYGDLTSDCTEEWQTACTSARSGDGELKGYFAENYYGSGSHRCMKQSIANNGVFNSTVTIRSCVIDIPSCADKEGTSFLADIRFPNDEGAEFGTDCHFNCAAKYSTEIDPQYVCTFTGQEAQYDDDPETDDPIVNNPDTNDPDYCNNSTYDGTEDGTCIDYNHPDNEGGCGQHGKSFGTVDFGFGEVTGCFGGGQNAYEPDADLDGDGINNEDDPDIDGDGIPNEDDPDENGDGINEKKDTDGDGIPDYKDPDIDGDGIPNGQDGDKDGDGIANEDEGEKEGAGDGAASTCAKKPTSTGDKQLAAIHMQLWLNDCKGKDAGMLDELKDINSKFDDLTDEVNDGDADQLTNKVKDDGISEFNDLLDDHIDTIGDESEDGGPMSGIVESSGLDSVFENLLPSASGCTPLQLEFTSKFSLPIPCEKFTAFKEWFGWALGILTIYSIIMLALSPAPSKV
ncbi:hypothetical protein [Zhongshania marina]|uniref:Thrombospondin type 3 repeat-containing protein n=1 Tax=Zhongshania marina TaxID=2304603 RepID=A0ABX9W8F3_9GAMM|nr:hypothetical protein D0911_02940 [Zhongshania marina]